MLSSPSVLRPWAPGSLTWRPVPPGPTRAGTRLSPVVSPRRVPSQAAGGPVRSHAMRERPSSPSALLRPAVAASGPPRAVLSVGCAFPAEPSRTAVLLRFLPGRWKGPLRRGRLTFRNPRPLACPLLVLRVRPLPRLSPGISPLPLARPQQGVRRAVGSMFHSLLKHSARIESAPAVHVPAGRGRSLGRVGSWCLKIPHSEPALRSPSARVLRLAGRKPQSSAQRSHPLGLCLSWPQLIRSFVFENQQSPCQRGPRLSCCFSCLEVSSRGPLGQGPWAARGQVTAPPACGLRAQVALLRWVLGAPGHRLHRSS